ncbi:MAG: DUF488 family protein [Pseudomonadota bacterium]|nr:DUF488 family protein [Pseudomonadota bacterium]
MSIQLKRVYDPPERTDGKRILVDRLWPRGLSRDSAKVDFWIKNIAPSTELRKWYEHDLDKWGEFKSRYFSELRKNKDDVNNLLNYVGTRTVTFVYGSKENHMNNAVALKEYLESDA